MATVPDSLVWELVRKNNSFLVKQFGNSNAKVQFSKEPNNLYNVHSYKFSGQQLSVAEFSDANVPIFSY
jgi:large subunit ribosomal protein L28e